MKRWQKALIALLAAVAISTPFVPWAAVWRGRGIFPSYYAKEVCSCLFVLEQDEAYCLALHAQLLPPFRVSIDRETSTVRVLAAFGVSTSSYQGARYGCAFEETPL